MRALYVGILTVGTTSRQRADTLRRLRPEWDWTVVDTDVPFRLASRWQRTLAFRAKAGPLVRRVNQAVKAHTAGEEYSLIWVDKGVYLWPNTVTWLRKRAHSFIHFTPDTAFLANRSRYFRRAASNYDLLVTTKSFDLSQYQRIAGKSKILITTQAFDAKLHYPDVQLHARDQAVVFIGLHEPDRERCIESLLRAGVRVRLGGQGWKQFVQRHVGNQFLNFIGVEVFGEAYATAYRNAAVGLGLLTRRFPELHTTRTFEIPACGALLATESNAETVQFFAPDEALFFSDYNDLAAQLKSLFEQPDELTKRAEKGYRRVKKDGRSYDDVLESILQNAGYAA